MVAPSPAVLRRRRIGALAGAIVLMLCGYAAVAGLPEPLAGHTAATAERLIAFVPHLLLLALALPLLAWIALRPQRGVLLLALTVPFHGLLVVVPVAPTFWKEALATWTLLCCVAATLGRGRSRLPVPKVAQPAIAYLVLGLASAAVVAVRFSPVQALVGSKISYFWMLVGVIAWWFPFDRRDRDTLVSILMGVSLVTTAYAFVQQALGPAGMNALGYEYNTTIRTTGPFLRSWSTFTLPFDFGLYLAMVLLITIPVCLTDFGRLRNRIYLCCTPLVALGMVSSFVRNAWLATIVGLGYLAVRRYRVLLLPVPFALLGLVMLPGQFTERALASESFNERQVGWGENFEKVEEVIGNGIGSVGSAAEKTLKTLDQTDFFYQPDNQYFKIAYELGIFGLAFFVMMLVYSVIEARQAALRVSGVDRAFVDGVTAHFLGVIVACVSSNYFETFPVDVMFWLLLGVVVTCGRESS